MADYICYLQNYRLKSEKSTINNKTTVIMEHFSYAYVKYENNGRV